MKFCTECHNMYYMTLTTEGGADNESKTGDNLRYYCRHCGHYEKAELRNQVFVFDDKHKESADFASIITPYTKDDPTLPRSYNIPCPNASCPTHVEEQHADSEVLYIRYDNDNLKYLYMCCNCDFVWK
jgi:DNA-directed RNA polymerase subunit M/transcription elongation factor TFIIS